MHLVDQEVIDSIQWVGKKIKKDDYLNAMIDVFSTQSEKLLTEILIHIKNNDAQKMYLAVHKFKGSALGLGCMGVASVCTEIEFVAEGKGHSDSLPSLYQDLKSVYNESIHWLEKQVN